MLDPGLVAEGREKELTTLSGQNALSVIPRSAVQRGTKTVRGRFVDNMKNGVAFYDIVAAFVHASIDEVVVVLRRVGTC